MPKRRLGRPAPLRFGRQGVAQPKGYRQPSLTGKFPNVTDTGTPPGELDRVMPRRSATVHGLLFERFAIEGMLQCSICGTCEILKMSWEEADGIKQRSVNRDLARQEPKVMKRLCVDGPVSALSIKSERM